MRDHPIAVENEAATKALPAEKERKPERVVRPHALEWDRIEGCPERRGLVGLDGDPIASVGPKDMTVKCVTIDELEAQLAVLHDPDGPHAKLLFELP